MRSILISLTIIIGLLVTLTSVGTLADFIDEDTESGEVMSGDVDIEIEGEGTFEFEGDKCEEIAPGDVCTESVKVKNVGDLEFTYTGSVSSSDECFNPTYAFVSTTSSESTGSVSRTTIGSATGTTMAHTEGSNGDGDDGDAMDPGEIDTYILSVTVDDVQDCQEKSGTITGTVIATQSSSPHN